MLAFAIYINDKKACTIGMDEHGVISSFLTWLRQENEPAGIATLSLGGLYSKTDTHVTWLERKLKKGDVVRIEIVEAAKVSRPKSTRRETPAMRTKHTKDYVRKTAESFGWTITEGKHEPNGAGCYRDTL